MLSPVDQVEFVALVGGLSQHETSLCMIAAEQRTRRHILQLGDDRGIVFFAGIDAFEQDLGHTGGVQFVLHHLRQAFSISGFVVKNGDLLPSYSGDRRRDEAARRSSRGVKAEPIVECPFGQNRIDDAGDIMRMLLSA